MNRQLIGLTLSLFFIFSLLIAKFYYIQISEGKKWEEVAKRQHFFVIQEPFQRGLFWSNTEIAKHHAHKPVPFVIDLQKYHLFLDPVSIPGPLKQELAQKLGKFVTTPSAILKELSRRSRARRLAMWLDREKRDEINAFWLPFAKKHKIARNALYFVKDYKRSYPFGSMLGQVLHTIQSQKEEKTLQAFPTGGLELSLNQYLKGKLGKKLLKRSPRHSFETGELKEEPIHGSDVYLTINHILQAICEEEIAKGVENVGAKSGWAVMMEPRTGEILALAQYPFFDPENYPKYFNDPNLLEHTRIKAITDANEPGSCMKPFTLAVALKGNQITATKGMAPIFDPEQMFPTSNGKFPGRSKEIKDVRLHNFLNMNMALQKSSNVYMAKLIQQTCECLGISYYRSFLHDTFGFGKKTGIELHGESSGILPTPGKIHPNGSLEWSLATPYSLAMGYNLQANSLQMIRAFSVIANGGYQVRPTLIKKIVNREGNVIVDHTNFEKQRVLDKAVVKKVIEAMRYVMKAGGSGARADVVGFSSAGKTSTVNKLINGVYSQKHHVASFIGFLPAEDPAFVLMVVLDEPDISNRGYFGGVAAAPVFQKIASRSVEYLGVSPDDPEKDGWKKEVKSLQEKYEKWNKL
jgi:cell division protein FtsI (penicillin-binding protein 3)